MRNNKIGMWACPRSRSTVTTRAFEQLEGCIVFNEPFWACHPTPDITPEMLNKGETNYRKVIAKLTADLPDVSNFSFQKLSTDLYSLDWGFDWLTEIKSFFLIRDPKDIIISYDKAMTADDGYKIKKITPSMIGINVLYEAFSRVKSLQTNPPLVVHSNDLVKNPHQTLKWLCGSLNLDFDVKMLTWSSRMGDSQIMETMGMFDTAWIDTLMRSTEFLPYENEVKEMPVAYNELLSNCMKYYEELLIHCHRFEYSEF